jgi:hypothetical protein
MGQSGIGKLTSGIGILHLLATLPLIALVAGDIFAAGIFGGASDSLPPTTSDYPAILAVFSTLAGVLLLIAGGLLTHMARHDPPQHAPDWFGLSFTAIGLVGVILMPLSGFWLLLALGLYSTWVGKRAVLSAGEDE